MEITLETKVKDLIKFQSDESEILEKQYITDNLENVKEIIIRYKPNKPKTFEEYRRACIFDWDLNSNIDLLQSICKDIGIPNEQMFVFIYKCIMDQRIMGKPLTDKFAILKDILPEDFIDELIK